LYDLKAFSTETLAESLANDYTTPSEVRDKNHFDYFLGYLIALDANTIIVEPDYVSKDYLHDYVSYYSLCHEKYPKTCKRVHFFSLPFSVQDFETWVNNGIPSVDIRNSYLGFIVVRPIPNTVIGFTILKTYQYSTGFGQRNYWGIKQYSIHLFGVELKLNSLAFQEQDSVVSACATAAIWSMLHGAAARSANTVLLKSPSEITRDAGNSSDGSRVFPNKGGLDGITFIFWGVAHSAKSFSNLKRKNFTSVTPLKLALKPFILELNDSAFALVLLLSKKFRMLSK